MTPEGRVKAKVNKALAGLSKTYRFMPVQNGMGAPGLDYYCCIDGLFVAIETKVPGKTLTPRQETTRDQILAAGGIFFEIHDQDETDAMVAQLNWRLNGNGKAERRSEQLEHSEAGCTQTSQTRH